MPLHLCLPGVWQACQLKQHYALNAFTGPLDCVRFTLRTKGPLGLYKGLTPWLVFAFPRSAVRFSTYEFVSQRFRETVSKESQEGELQNGKLDPYLSMAAGSIAGAVEFLTVGTPMQCIQVKMAHDAYSKVPRFHGFVSAIVGIVRAEGLLKGLYAGLGPTVLKGAVNNCIRFSTFSELKYIYQKYKLNVADNRLTATFENFSTCPESDHFQAVHEAILNPLETMLLGATSGGLSAIATHPIDTVKSNMQSLSADKYTSSWNCFLSILRNQGLPGLYQGMAPRFVRVSLEIGLHFSLYEQIACRIDESLFN
ncbi:tricarboxylate transport mitochondrial-like protein [Nannochloropsis gaditana]|uniref:Tricarboxylate transport mitochondrial-like protein n=1 Tax=Nannochloropsis gaditana TaxID=72520 RepID=W7TRJ8_9STRA|nr:tricarboxylate transport mitochondrial-like protein [Nannochloropsis gaditana]